MVNAMHTETVPGDIYEADYATERERGANIDEPPAWRTPGWLDRLFYEPTDEDIPADL